MRDRILIAINELKTGYMNGNYTSKEYHELLNKINNATWLIDKFDLGNIDPSEIQQIIHKEQEII